MCFRSPRSWIGTGSGGPGGGSWGLGQPLYVRRTRSSRTKGMARAARASPSMAHVMADWLREHKAPSRAASRPLAVGSRCGNPAYEVGTRAMVPVVYSRKYNITAFGLERLHPFDG